MKIKSKFLSRLNEEFLVTTDTLWANEIQANKYVTKILLETAFIDLVFMVCSWLKIFSLDMSTISLIMIQSFLELVAAALICLHFKGEKKWLKSVLLFFYTLVLARVTMVLTHNVLLAMVFPTVVSVRYYSKPVTATVSLLSAILFPLADYLSIKFQTGIINLNVLKLTEGTKLYWDKTTTVREIIMSQAEIDYSRMWADLFRHYEIPKLVLFIMVSIICMEIAKRGRMAIFAQKEETEKAERISAELNLASSIQANMLPNIFPAFPDRNDFDIYALNTPAKEVGGDFYDYFMVDNNKIALIMADVSGKGIPAALFMVIAKTLIKDHAQLGLSPKDIMTKVNNILCEGNENGLFVTAWLGILDLSSGILTFSNAGHNPPIIYRKNNLEYLYSRSGFVLAGMENYVYKESELELNKGDKIFLYTDGATEAMDINNAQYGEKRLIDSLSNCINKTCKDAVDYVVDDIHKFVGEAEQFDDLTLMAFDFSEKH